ncbi:protein RoBo-1-like [Peromyscus californicus insignis]|uniref:protein RoBo-1-like n=1 Tax=Peromyscus californicus insignis TaxID=564181 RepID=UPI0022A73409|nr:protein RoBo-1-like [Peromyscus californicus insignis]
MAWSCSLKSLLTVFVFTIFAVPISSAGNINYKATLGDQQTFRYNQQCCNTAKCDQESTQLSLPPAEANGVQCLSYYMESGVLNIPTLLSCTGNETKCGLVIGTVVGSSNPFSLVMAGMGCATESACNLTVTVLNQTNIRTFCSDEFVVSPSRPSVPDSTDSAGSMGFRPTAISTVPILITLLLLKVLF